jgi:cytochrome b561
MSPVQQFAWSSRVLHWLMAALVLAMLFIGVAMMSSLLDYHRLVSIHRPLGIAILILVVIRFINRQLQPMPPFPATMSPLERLAAASSERMLYALMFVLPLVGWGMLSAARYPIVLFGPIQLPPILPQNAAIYTVLRKTHAILAYLLFFIILAHLGAVLFHTLVIRDGLLNRMALWNVPPGEAAAVRHPPTPPAGSDPV